MFVLMSENHGLVGATRSVPVSVSLRSTLTPSPSPPLSSTSSSYSTSSSSSFSISFRESSSMSSHDMHDSSASFDCEATANLASIAPCPIMPVLHHHSKRKRLNAVLTKLTLSTCKDELDEAKDSSLSKHVHAATTTNLIDDTVFDDKAERQSADGTTKPNSSFTEAASASTSLETSDDQKLGTLLYLPPAPSFEAQDDANGDARDKTPLKQRSLDSEMSNTVRNLNLDIAKPALANVRLWSVIDDDDEGNGDGGGDGDAGDDHAVAEEMSSREGEHCSVRHSTATEPSSSSSFINSSSNLVATSTSSTTFSSSSPFTPPTTGAAGGSTTRRGGVRETTSQQPSMLIKIESYDDEQQTEVTDMTTVMRHTSDNSFSSHSQQKQLPPSSPRTKLLSHDSRRHRLSENASFPDATAQTRSRGLVTAAAAAAASATAVATATTTTRPAATANESTSSPDSPPFGPSLLGSLSYLGPSLETALSSSLPAFSRHCSCSPVCSEKPCPKMAPLPGHHAWSWNHSLSKQDPYLLDPFSYLLSASAKSAIHEKPHSPQEATAPLSPLSHRHLHTSPPPTQSLEAAAKVTSYSRLTSNQKKRSHSDSDMYPEYLSLFQSLNAHVEASMQQQLLQQQQQQQQQQEIRQQHSQQYLPLSESGVLIKNGRRVPKPLSKATLQRASEPSEKAQESPLDLTVKPLSAHIISEELRKYSRLLTFGEQSIGSGNSCSVPALSTVANQPYLFALPRTLSPLTFHIQSSGEHKSPYKRRNICGGDGISLSPPNICRSPLENKNQSARSLSTNLDFYPDDKGKIGNRSSDSPPMRQFNQEADGSGQSSVSSSKSKGSRHKLSSGGGRYCEDRTASRTASLSSLSDLDMSSSLEHECNICGQTFSYYDRLAKHKACRHRNRQQCDTTAKNYLCDVCQRSFARSDMLTRHMRLHTGIKPYTCAICSQVFSRSDHLSTHQRTHTGEKPYKCPQCPYAACRRDMITRHMKTHSRFEIPDSSSSFEDLSKSA